MTKTKIRLRSLTPIFLAVMLLPSSTLLAQSGEEDEAEHKQERRYIFIGGDEKGEHPFPLMDELHGRGYLGVHLMHLTQELRTHFGAPEDAGVMVAKVVPESPAEQAGVQVGDILVTVDGEKIDSPRKLSRTIREKEEGDTVSLEILRNGGLQIVSVTIAERERHVMKLGGPNSPLQGIKVIDGPHETFDFTWDGQDFRINEHVTEALGRAMEGLEEHFDSEEWQERLERIQSMDWDGVSQRMKELEERLKALEEELAKEEGEQEHEN
jgi:membrane-associated protease RseP (regulator of RpoE activity)